MTTSGGLPYRQRKYDRFFFSPRSWGMVTSRLSIRSGTTGSSSGVEKRPTLARTAEGAGRAVLARRRPGPRGVEGTAEHALLLLGEDAVQGGVVLRDQKRLVGRV